MKHCIIHRRLVEIEKINPTLSKKSRERANIAHKTILELIENDENLILFDTENPKKIPDYFQKGDEVMLHGAYLGMCLSTVYNGLIKKGVSVEIYPKGCI
tara:strand:+ start:232 stop:531 length:300 start_codon:yes stop_codon:yes gene_type:complete